jgi:hypothetical protein
MLCRAGSARNRTSASSMGKHSTNGTFSDNGSRGALSALVMKSMLTLSSLSR